MITVKEFDEMKDRACELLKEGKLTPREISREVGIALRTVQRLSKDITPKTTPPQDINEDDSDDNTNDDELTLAEKLGTFPNLSKMAIMRAVINEHNGDISRKDAIAMAETLAIELLGEENAFTRYSVEGTYRRAAAEFKKSKTNKE